MAFLQEYSMLGELGRGGFATVYKVRHNELGYIRAIRVLNETIVDASSQTYQKFLRECKLLLRLGNGNHPNIVHIYQPRLLENKALVEMDYVDGKDILQYLNQNQNFVPATEVIRMALQMSGALAYCHEDIYRFCMDREQDNLKDDPDDGSKVLIDEPTRKSLIAKYKVIHNDIHSGNIMRREDGNYVLLDFGLAIEGDNVVRSSRRKNGAPEFKAPEKWKTESILSEQSDIYSFGIVMYQFLAGRVPFPYNTAISSHIAEYELGEAHQKTAPPSIEKLRKEFFERKYRGKKYEKDYPEWLEDVILKCLQKDPSGRFRNGKELCAAVTAGVAQMSNRKVEELERCVAKLMDEKENLQKSLQRQESGLQQTQAELQTKEAALEEEKLKLKGEQTRLQNHISELEEKNQQLGVEKAGLQNRISDLDKEGQRLVKEKDGLKTRISDMEEEVVRLKIKLDDPSGGKSPSKWMIISGILLFLLLASGVGFWLTLKDKIRECEQVRSEYGFDVDILQEENAQYQAVIDSLQTAMQGSASDQVKSLTEALEESKRQYEELNTQYNDLRNRNGGSGSGDYRGHNAQYWYNNRLYNNHDARYWYEENEKTKKQRDTYKTQRDNYKRLLDI